MLRDPIKRQKISAKWFALSKPASIALVDDSRNAALAISFVF